MSDKLRRSQRKRLQSYAFLKPTFRTRPRKETRSMLPLHQKYAALADIAFKRNAVLIEKALVTTGLNEEFKYHPEYSSSETRVFESPSTKQIITAFKASKFMDHNFIDITLTGDVATDLTTMVALEQQTKVMKRSLKQWQIVNGAFPHHEHVLIGHSVGGAMARNIFNHFPDNIQEVHTFNPSTGLAQMAQRTLHEDKYHSHYMLGDPLEVLGLQSLPNTHVYIPQDEVAHANLLKTFLNTN